MCLSHSPALLDLFLSSDASICSTIISPSLGNSDHVAVWIFTDCPSKSKKNASFHCIAYDYSCTDWDNIHDHFSDAPLEDIFKPSGSAAASESCECFQVETDDAYIPHCKNQVKPHSPPWFSAACASAIVHRNHFFCLYQQNKSSESKVKFRKASNYCKKVLEATWLIQTILIKQKSPSLPRNFAFETFD